MTKSDEFSAGRRAALVRLGLGAVVAYATPAFTTLSQAHASSGSGGGSGGSGGGGGDGGSGGSGGDAGDGGSGGSGGASGGEADTGSSAASAASAASGASAASSDGPATISSRDHRKAQRAVQEGRALPLREVLKTVNESVNGRLISVSFKEDRRSATYVLRMVSDTGRLMEVSVDARTARILEGGS